MESCFIGLRLCGVVYLRIHAHQRCLEFMRRVRNKVLETECLLMDFFHRLIEFFAYPVDFIIRMSGDLYFLIEPIDTQRIEESKQLVELLERTIDEDA